MGKLIGIRQQTRFPTVYTKKDLAAIGKVFSDKKIGLLIIANVHPFVKKLRFLCAVLGKLGGGY